MLSASKFLRRRKRLASHYRFNRLDGSNNWHLVNVMKWWPLLSIFQRLKEKKLFFDSSNTSLNNIWTVHFDNLVVTYFQFFEKQDRSNNEGINGCLLIINHGLVWVNVINCLSIWKLCPNLQIPRLTVVNETIIATYFENDGRMRLSALPIVYIGRGSQD